MANWSDNEVIFYGDTASLQKEMDSLISTQSEDTQKGVLPDQFKDLVERDLTSSDCMFDIEFLSVSDSELSIRYNSEGGISIDVLGYIASKHNLNFKGTFVDERNRVEASGYVIGVKDHSGRLETNGRTLTACGINLERSKGSGLSVDEENMLADLSSEFTNKFIYVASQKHADTAFELASSLAANNIALLNEIRTQQ